MPNQPGKHSPFLRIAQPHLTNPDQIPTPARARLALPVIQLSLPLGEPSIPLDFPLGLLAVVQLGELIEEG